MKDEKKKAKQQAQEDDVLLELSSMIENMDDEQCLDEEKQRLKEQLTSLQVQYRMNLELLATLRDEKDAMDDAKSKFDAAVGKVNGIVTNINKAINAAKTAKIKVDLEDGAKQDLTQRNADLISDTDEMFTNQLNAMKEISSQTSGIYMSARLFFSLLFFILLTESYGVAHLVKFVGDWFLSVIR